MNWDKVIELVKVGDYKALHELGFYAISYRDMKIHDGTYASIQAHKTNLDGFELEGFTYVFMHNMLNYYKLVLNGVDINVTEEVK